MPFFLDLEKLDCSQLDFESWSADKPQSEFMINSLQLQPLKTRCFWQRSLIRQFLDMAPM